MTPYVIDAVGLNRRAPGPATRRTAVFSHPIALWQGLGSTECPIPGGRSGLYDHASAQCSMVLPSLMLGRNHLGNPGSKDREQYAKRSKFRDSGLKDAGVGH